MFRFVRAPLLSCAIGFYAVTMSACGSHNGAIPVTQSLGPADVARAAASSRATPAATYTYFPVPPRLVSSIIQGSDDDIWFANDSDNPAAPSYIGRISKGAVSLFALPSITVGGVPHAVSASTLVQADRPAGPLFFSWLAPDGSDFGLGTVDLQNPSQMQLTAAKNPGDPLYAPTIAQQFGSLGLLSTNGGTQLWGFGATVPANGSTSLENLWNLSYPAATPPNYATYVIPPVPASEVNAQDIILGEDGHVWFSDFANQAIGRVNSTITEFPVGGQPGALVAGSDGNLWATTLSEVPWFYSIVRANYAGAITGRFATPPLGFDIYTLAAAKDGVWTTSRNASASTFILVRLSSQGAYSWYSLPSPFGSDVVVPTALAVSGNGTLWFGVSDNNAQGSVVGSFTPNHIITAKPFAVNLISGSTTTVTLSEHAFAGTFTAAVANELSPGNETPCPITVTPASGTTFTLRATGSVPTRCGVTFTDDTGVGSAWVTVNSP